MSDESEITYIVRQRTSAPDHKIAQVIERFERELKLQFGSSITVEVADRP